VIMGILAAVAVPKLFGMIAKSKASEVGPAAGTYVKLQQAYFSESNQVGTWTLIGYKGPGNNTSATASETTNFNYGSGMTAATSVGQAPTTKTAWYANNRTQLNDCAVGQTGNPNWYVDPVVTASNASTGADIGFDSHVTAGGCQSLTPSFETIGD